MLKAEILMGRSLQCSLCRYVNLEYIPETTYWFERINSSLNVPQEAVALGQADKCFL